MPGLVTPLLTPASILCLSLRPEDLSQNCITWIPGPAGSEEGSDGMGRCGKREKSGCLSTLHVPLFLMLYFAFLFFWLHCVAHEISGSPSKDGTRAPGSESTES